MARLARIRIYPIKSCRGYDVQTAELDSLGLVGDRRFQIVNQEGKPFTQRTHPALACAIARLGEETLHIEIDGLSACDVPLAFTANPQTVTTEVWSSTNLQADLASTEADALFTKLLNEPARLVRAGSAFDRPVKNHPDHRVGFADAYPLLAISEASLAELSDRMLERGAEPAEMERFRPNFIIADASSHEEDTWDAFHVGELPFKSAGVCERCIMTTVDPLTGDRSGGEPLATLATYRRAKDSNAVVFGQNVVNLADSGIVRVGDLISPQS